MKMKLLSVSLLASFFLLTSFVSPGLRDNGNTVAVNAKVIFIPIGGAPGTQVSLFDLRNMTKSQLEELTGRKMNFAENIAFNKAQKRLKKDINEQGEVTGKKLKKMMYSSGDGTTGFHIGGFALGFLVGLIGVLIAYLIKDDKKKNRVKWAWIGLAAWLVIYLAIILPAL